MKRMLYTYLHSSKSKRTESLDSWEPAMVITSLCGIKSLTLKITPPCKSLEWVGQPTLLTRHSWVAWVDAKESLRLRTWASASLKSRKKVAKESQSKHPFRLCPEKLQKKNSGSKGLMTSNIGVSHENVNICRYYVIVDS